MGATAQKPAEKRSFSPDHGFSRAEVADAASLVATEGPRKRLLINVTMGHRTLARRQAFVSQSIGVFFLVAIYVTALVSWPVGTVWHVPLGPVPPSILLILCVRRLWRTLKVRPRRTS